MNTSPDTPNPAALAADLGRLLELLGPLRVDAHLEANNREYRQLIADLARSPLAGYVTASTIAALCSEMVRAHYAGTGRPFPTFWAFDPSNLSGVDDPHLAEGILVGAQLVSTLLNHDAQTTSALLLARVYNPRALFVTLAGLLSVYAGLWADDAARAGLVNLSTVADLEHVIGSLMPTGDDLGAPRD